VACQFHPEFKSRPLEPHPLFKRFVHAALEHTSAHQRDLPRASNRTARLTSAP
jgi:CTP synthase